MISLRDVRNLLAGSRSLHCANAHALILAIAILVIAVIFGAPRANAGDKHGSAADRLPVRSASQEEVGDSRHGSHAGDRAMIVSSEAHPAASARPSTRRATDRNRASLEEVVVTGTHLLGVHTTASPLSRYSRADIYATGASDIYQFMQTLPAALGDVNPLSPSSNQYGRANLLDNASQGVGFDLRGLGPQSTLVLVNGERLAPGNITGNFVDVSLIPLNAISGIDVVRDSASATYGSDAVGGVVNIHTLKRFVGSESAVRYGSVASGGRRDLQFDQTVGTSWNGGSAVVSYEFDDQTPLDARSRTFTANLPHPYTLFPEQVRHGVYGSFKQSFDDDLSVSGFALYGHRTDRAQMVQAGIYYLGGTKVDSYMAALKARKSLPSDAVGTATIDYSGNATDFNQLAQLGPGLPFATWDSPHGRSTLLSAHLGYSGWVGHLDGRRAGLAVGIQGQEDSFAYDNFWAPSPSHHESRSVVAEYLEVKVPVTRSTAFEASLRHERYSDFGSTTNPKFGVEWKPNSSIELAGTYSTSFVAPTLSELVPDSAEAGYLPVPSSQASGGCSLANPSNPACAIVLTTGGGNPNLGAEKARTWTGTVRLHPAAARGLRAELSVYDIHETGVINTIFSYLPSVFQCYELAGELGPPVVTGIDAAQARARFPNASNPFNVNEASVVALCDGRYLNLSRLSTSGLDLQVKYFRDIGGVRWMSMISGTRVLRYRTQFSAAAPQVSFLDSVNNPVSLRLRFGETVSISRMSASVFANYVGPYINNIVSPNQKIASWMTLDLIGTYSTRIRRAGHGVMSVTVGVSNLTDRNPPYVFNGSPAFPMDFDGANASPLGRYLYVETKLRL